MNGAAWALFALWLGQCCTSLALIWSNRRARAVTDEALALAEKARAGWARSVSQNKDLLALIEGKPRG